MITWGARIAWIARVAWVTWVAWVAWEAERRVLEAAGAAFARLVSERWPSLGKDFVNK